MATDAETLTSLVADRVGDGREYTYRAFEDRAVDPETGYRPSKSTVWKVSRGEDVKVSPALVRAFAAGLSLPLARVQAAAAFQYTGLVTSVVGGATVVHEPGVTPEKMASEREIARRWEEESGIGCNHSGG